MPRKQRPREVPLKDLVLDSKCQVRAGLNGQFVEELAEALRSGSKVTPVDVVGVDKRLYVVNGHHRAAAAQAAGLEKLPAIVVGEGDLDFAVWTTCAANKDQNSLRRSNEDKRRAVLLALDGSGQDQSDRVIAEHIGVSNTFVGKIRKEWEARQLSTVDSCDDTDGSPPSKNERFPTRKRRGKDGKLRAQRSLRPPNKAKPVEPVVPMPSYRQDLDNAGSLLRQTHQRLSELWPKTLSDSAAKVLAFLDLAIEATDECMPRLCGECVGAGCTRCDSRGWTTGSGSVDSSEVGSAS